MRIQRLFTIPDHLALLETSIVTAFIKRVPATWKLRTGILDAPYNLVTDGTALNYTKLQFGTQIDQMISGIDHYPADIVGILIKNKMPGQVEFGNPSGMAHCEVLSPADRITVACHFIQAGYRGRLRFAENLNDEDVPPMACDVFLPLHAPPRELAAFTVEMENEKFKLGWGNEIFDFAKKILQPVPSRAEQPAVTA